MGSPSSARSTRAYSERSAWYGPSDEDIVVDQERTRLGVVCPRPVLLPRHGVDVRTMRERVVRLEPHAGCPDDAAVSRLNRVANWTSAEKHLQILRVDQAVGAA